MRPLISLLALLPLTARAQNIVALAPQVVTAARADQSLAETAATVRVIDGDTLRQAPVLSTDAALRAVPAFSLFRRSDSLTANPTAQGVSLRGLGPSGASRSVVLLDGIPLNDPFGGWVAWSKVPRETLLAAEIVPGGGATAWGNAALGGVVQLRSHRAIGQLRRAAVSFGDLGTRSAEVSTAHSAGNGSVSIAGKLFSIDGFSLVAPERRGAIDVDAWSRHRWLNAGATQTIAGVNVAANARVYEERRGNGTPYQQNRSRETFASLTAGQSGTEREWEAAGYVQDQSFASTFSAVNATRTAETPASDQYAVPAFAAGASWVGVLRRASNGRTNFGADVRFVRGETREHFTFVNGNFSRQRVAGGRQLIGGAFVLHERPLASKLRGTAGARLDGWRETDGHRRELDRVTGLRLRDERYASRRDILLSPSLGAVWSASPTLRFRGHAQQAFRRPTLNELYRPFRVGPNVTEANAGLDTERATSAEAGVEWTIVPPTTPGASALTLGATAYWNDLRDTVGNVTLARGPGTFPIVGVIAAGGVGRQRLNLDRARVRGLELSAGWQLRDAATLSAELLLNDARITQTTLAPALIGKRLAQVPRTSAAVTGRFQLPGKFALMPRLRWLGRQFEDDENQLTLGAAVVADLAVSRPLTRQIEVFLSCENVGNTRLETGRTADGIVNIGTPRLIVGGVRGSW